MELVTGEWLDGKVFLSLSSEHHQGPEQIIDLLRRDESFIPFRLNTGAMRMIERLTVVQIQMPRESGIHELDPAGLLEKTGKLQPAVLALRIGEKIAGDLPIFPENLQNVRVLDWLNEQGDFIPILTAEKLIYVARSAILWAEESEPTE